MTTKFERQGMILRLVQEQRLHTQAEVADALRANGVDAVQATVSRDIAQLGLTKVRNGEGRLVYALPGAADLRRIDELSSALRRYMGATAPSGTILVVARGTCARVAKAIYAQQAGAQGVIMVNNSSAFPPYEGPITSNPDTGAKFNFWHPDLFTMHVWIWYPNPAGLYSGTNPLVAPFNGN